MRTRFKRFANTVSLILICPVWCLLVLGKMAIRSDEVFMLFAHFFAFIPGTLGEFARRAYYWWALESCGVNLVVGFGSFLTSQDVQIGNNVWIGQYTIVGSATIASRVLISDHVSVLTGRHQHRRDVSGAFVVDRDRRVVVSIGQDTWIGAGAIIMADVGGNCTVGAGAVVVKVVPPDATVVGVPAHIVTNRQLG